MMYDALYRWSRKARTSCTPGSRGLHVGAVVAFRKSRRSTRSRVRSRREAPSFTKAAAELFLTHSAVSQRVTQLEKHLDTRLFARSRRGVE